ncbi:MAG: glutamine-hydrolyzing carbamoyl-phosphate synthase small subunit [Gammaproteobacteria bacterium]|nr:MAG: glutamine-hydrolyzing carbamoyl-phosphate synthase small subunit [Gammaproteobacteria bacterium]
MNTPALLVLEDGSLFEGVSIGIKAVAVGEVVFNTAMTGYQEILTDPSYAQQIVTLTYPHIGNTGTNPQDSESIKAHAAGLVIRDLPLLASSWRNESSLDDYFKSSKIVAIAGIDTRRLTRLLRDKGAQNGCLMAGDNLDKDDALARARDFAGLKGMDLASGVTTDTSYDWDEGLWDLHNNSYTQPLNDAGEPLHVVAYDFGIKRNILRMLAACGCRMTVVPARTPAGDVLAMQPDGVFLSNGPGDPEPCDYAIDAIRQLLSKDIPIFGICLGHQLLALASGARTVKMKFGHHGANHPVQELAGGRVLITSQNHGFAVDEASLPEHVRATHRSLFDGSLQGIELNNAPAFGFQGHPEASPGPHDVSELFDRFVALMRART